MPTPMEQLKNSTADLHEALEAVAQSQRIMDKSLTLTQFQQMMANHYRLHWLLEPTLAASLDRTLPELAYGSQRTKLSALVEDLESLDLKPADLQTGLPETVPELNSLATALGVAYVLEGSSLGGQVIRKALSQHPEISARCSFAYYRHYGSDVRQRWVDFAATVNQRLSTAAEQQAACQAAQQTFRLATQVFALPLP